MLNRSRFRPKPSGDADSSVNVDGKTGRVKQSPAQVDTLQTLREGILRNVLTASVIFGVIAFIATLPTRLAEKQYLLIGLFSFALLTVIIITVVRSSSYRLRAASLIFLISMLSVSTLLSDGLFGNGRIFLLALPIIIATLIGERPALWSLGLSVALVALIAGLMLFQVIPPAEFLFGNVNADLRYWILAVATWILVGSVTTISVVVMLRGLRNLVEAEKQLRQELDQERTSLAGRVQERTRVIEYRLSQIRSAAEIARSLGSELEPQKLLQLAVNQIQQGFDLYYAGVFLVDERGEHAVLAAGSGEAGLRMVNDGYYLPLTGNSTVAWSINNYQARIAIDVGREAVRFNNPHLPFTRSEMVLPIIVSQQVNTIDQDVAHTESKKAQLTRSLGALSVQSTRSQAFDRDDLTVFQGIAISLGNALENATLFQQIQRNLQEIRTLNRQYLEKAWSIQSLRDLKSVSEDKILLGKKSKDDESVLDNASTSLPLGEGWISVDMPLSLREQVIGHLNVETPNAWQQGQLEQDNQLSPEDHALLETVATEATIALENVRLLEASQRRAGYERLLAEITQRARSATDLETILRSTVRELGKALNVTEAEISLHMARDATAQLGTTEDAPVVANNQEDDNSEQTPTQHS